MSEMTNMSAFAIAESVNNQTVTATSVVEKSLALAEALNSKLNAFLAIDREGALRAAAKVDSIIASGGSPGRLAGVPIALKDNMCKVGLPTTCGSRILQGWIPPYDATVTKLLESEGAIIVGKTNLDEFAMGSSTENSAYGPTLNPVDLTRVPGGSSGGSASSVAAGIVPVALGSDTGGSIRQPASLCGVVGVKPTYGRVSRYGLVAFASSLDQIGPFSSSVMDSALTLEVIAGFDLKDSTSYDEQMGSLSAQKGLSVEGLRVGMVTEFVEGSDLEVVSALRDAANALTSLGADVVEISIPETKLGLSAYYLIAPAEASSNLARFDGVRFGLRVEGSNIEETNVLTRTKGFGAEVKRRIMLGTYALSSGYYDAYYAKAQQVRTLIKSGFERAYQQVDVLISPVSPTTAFKLGEKSLDPLAMYLSDVCTIPSNLAGHPAMSMPYALDSKGLPIGVQILAPALREDLMFRLAFALEGSSTGAPSLDDSIKEAINRG